MRVCAGKDLLIVDGLPVVVLGGLVCSVRYFSVRGVVVVFTHGVDNIVVYGVGCCVSRATTCFNGVLNRGMTLRPTSGSLLIKVPVGISSEFSFCGKYVLKRRVLVTCLGSNSSIPPTRLGGRLSVVNQRARLIIMLVAPYVSSCGGMELITRGIGFIVPGERVFLPSLLLSVGPSEGINLSLGRAVPPFTRYLLLCRLRVRSLIKTANCKLDSGFNISCTATGGSLH